MFERSVTPTHALEQAVTTILMPTATAVWLIDNTSLTFDQVAEFCGLHPLEVRSIADGQVAKSIRGVDPVASGELQRDEIERATADPNYRMKVTKKERVELPTKRRTVARFTPVTRRQDRPKAILWFLRNHPEISDPQISKLIGTTKATIEQVRQKRHWDIANLRPVDPVTLGLCSQIELDDTVRRAAERRAKLKPELPIDEGPRLTDPE